MKIGKSYRYFHVLIILPDGHKYYFYCDEDNLNYLESLSRPDNIRIIKKEHRFTVFVERSEDDNFMDIFNIDNYL